jgi:hypothetical protein
MAEEAPATSGQESGSGREVEVDKALFPTSGHGEGEGNTMPLDPEALKIHDGEGDVEFDDVSL